MPDTQPLIDAMRAFDMRTRARYINALSGNLLQAATGGQGAEAHVTFWQAIIFLLVETELELNDEFVEFQGGHEVDEPRFDRYEVDDDDEPENGDDDLM